MALDLRELAARIRGATSDADAHWILARALLLAGSVGEGAGAVLVEAEGCGVVGVVGRGAARVRDLEAEASGWAALQ